jgi:membrane-associated protease RseP (regulator of RpoE activity)
MHRISTLLLAAVLAAAPAVAFGDPARDSQTESFEMMSMGKGRLGVFVLGITPELRKHYGVPDDRGVLVARVEAGSPAASAGLQAGDIITDAGGRVIDQAGDLASAIAAIGKGTSVDLKVVRDHKPLSVSAKLTSDPIGFMDFGWLHEMFRRFEQPMPSVTST